MNIGLSALHDLDSSPHYIPNNLNDINQINFHTRSQFLLQNEGVGLVDIF